MHACMFIFEVKLLPGILESVLGNYSEVQFDITTCKHDLRMLNLHANIYNCISICIVTENYNDIFQVARTQDRYIAMHEQ